MWNIYNHKLMESYNTPNCVLTKQPATVFCFAGDCSLPAFGCTSNCLQQHTHGKDGLGSRFKFWSQIEPSVRRIIDGGLTESDVEALKKQEKLIMTLIDQLREMHQNHTSYIRNQRKSL